MAKNPRDYISDALDELKAGLGPPVTRQFKMRYSAKSYLQEMDAALNAHSPGAKLRDESDLNDVDALGWLNLIIRRWDEAFAKKLGQAERSYANEMRETRHDWAHQKKRFTNEEARRFCDTAKLLLQSVNATDQAAQVERLHLELSREHFERQAVQAAKPPKAAATRMTMPTLKPWRQIIEPHPDVRSGRFAQAEFAADLGAVMRGAAAPEYAEAGPFFERTYMTEGLRDLVVNGIKRLTGAGGDPVVQLQTNFGGGKTHSMLALYHAFSDDFKLSSLRDYDEIRRLAGDVDDDLQARRAVIVGTSFNVSQPRQYRDCSTRTIWGEIAYQLGGAEAYELVAQNDLEGTNPGADTLVKLMEDHGPALIILDELARLTQQLYGVAPAPAAGSFETALAFMQSLTEAVSGTSDALLLVSIPASEIEIGGEGGYTTLEKLRQTLGRIESVWKPVSAEESYEIVRRRLFSEVADYPARDAVVNAFYKMYNEHKSDYPRDAAEGDYRRKMRQAYPIHPELFDRLYEDWSTLERFQRTRGVLRLMAQVIFQLWIEFDQSLMIMPGSIPLNDRDVEGEITKYLKPRNYSPVVEADIDGQRSKPRQIDSQVNQLGKYNASRRVARAIFMGSSPTKQTRGLNERRINLATTQPGERASVFGDALRRMSSQLTYLHNDGRNYWYDTRATVNRTAEDRAQDMDPYKVLAEAGRRLREQKWDRRLLGSAHLLPESSAEIPDEQSFRVVLLGPEHTHKSNNSESEALLFIKRGKMQSDGLRDDQSLLFSRGNSPRHHRNMLVFIAPDETRNAEWAGSIRKYLAWQSIEADRESLNLDVQQSKQVEEALRREDETVQKQLQETYCWLIVPQQPDPTDEISLAVERIRVSENFFDGAALKLQSSGWLFHHLSPESLLLDLEPLNIWKDSPHLSLKRLWDWLTNYCYLPRLFDRGVLEEAIKQGVNQIGPAFGYAARVNNDGGYDGLKWEQAATLYFDQHDVIVRPDIARAQRAGEIAARERAMPAPPDIADATPSDETPIAPPDDAPPPPKPKTRYYGSVRINPQRPIPEIDAVTKEVLEHLTKFKDSEVEVTIEISGWRKDGFDETTMRAISENSRTLNFREHGFEE